MMHRLLERQLKRYLGEGYQPDEKLKALLNVVDEYYHLVDKEQRLLQNALSTNASELNEVNERLRVQNAEMTRTLLNTLSDGVYATDLQGQVTFMNAAAETMLEKREAELIGQSIHKIVQHHDAEGNEFPADESPQNKVIQKGEPIEGSSYFITTCNRFIPVNYRARPIVQNGEIIGALVSFQDVSTIKHAENKLREAYDHLNETLTELNFQKHALDQHAIVSIAAADGKIIYANERFSKISQYAMEELIGQDHRLVNSGFHSREFFAQMWQCISSGKVWNGEVKNRRKDGTFYWVESTIVPFMDENEKPLRYVSIRTDITLRKEMEERIQLQSAFYEQISETLGEGLYVQDAQGNCIYMNSEAERLLGWNRKEFIGMPVHDTIHMLTPDGKLMPGNECAIMQDILQHGRSHREDQVFFRKDGGSFPVEVSSMEIRRNGEFQGAVVAFQDITERKDNERFIQQTQERLNLSLEGSNLALWDWDIAADHIYLSDRWSMMMGGAQKEVLLNSAMLFDLVHPDDRPIVKDQLVQVVKGISKYYSVEFRITRNNGELAWIHTHGKVVERNANGMAIRMTGTNADITERKLSEEALHKSETRLRTLYDSTSDAVMLLDENGFFDCNQATLQLFGCNSREAFCAMGPADLSPELQPDGLNSLFLAQQHIAQAMQQGSRRFEWVHKRADSGETFDAEVLLNAMTLDGKWVLQATVRDIRERKQAEEIMRQAKDAAEQSAKVKSDFLANMSHEIRTPMNGIIGMTELVLDTELTQEQREYVDLVKVSADALLAVVNDILDFSKIESGKMNIESIEFSLETMLHNSIRSMSVKAHEKNIELLLHVAPDVPDRLRGDPGRLRQVIVNLVSNAIKFTEAGEFEVSVKRVSNPDHDKASLYFAVRDTGIGIPQDKFKIIFDSFSQADTSTTRKFGGTGLGLSISSRLVALMGGEKIDLESELGKGSTFSFELPMSLATPIQPVNLHDTPYLAGLEVLVVEDNATTCEILREMLTNWKMLPTFANSCSQALTKVSAAAQENKTYPLALIDVPVLETGGAELMEKISGAAPGKSEIVMMLNSEGQRGQFSDSGKFGKLTYFVKPITSSGLLDAIMDALGQARQNVTQPAPAAIVRSSGVPLNILLAEDNTVNQVLAIRLLEKAGHKVSLANNGSEAVTLWNNNEFDVILMDVDMPVMNGYEATEKIREREHSDGGHIPIIAMTAHAMKGAREQCLRHGMDGYLPKPIDTKALWQELDVIISGKLSNSSLSSTDNTQAVIADLDQAMETMDNSLELFDEITNLFIVDAPLHLQRIREGLATNDAAQVRLNAHTIKGMVGIFAAEKTIQSAIKVEKLAGQEACAEAVESLEDALVELIDTLKTFQAQRLP